MESGGLLGLFFRTWRAIVKDQAAEEVGLIMGRQERKRKMGKRRYIKEASQAEHDKKGRSINAQNEAKV
jgi:hypothetical protein